MKTKYFYVPIIVFLSFLSSCASNEDEHLQNRPNHRIDITEVLMYETTKLNKIITKINKIDESIKSLDRLHETFSEELHYFRITLNEIENLITSSDINKKKLAIELNKISREINDFAQQQKIYLEDLDITDQNFQNQQEIFMCKEYKIILGNVSILKCNSEKIDFLKSIRFIGGDLLITNNSNLSNLDGLENLTFIGGKLNIYENKALRTLNGLNNLVSIENDLYIGANNNLSNLDGLENLILIGRGLLIGSNNELLNIDGLKKLTTIRGVLVIGFNPALSNLDGLRRLNSLGSFLFIDSNTSLLNIKGLSNLTSVKGNLFITNNHKLFSFCGLQPLFINKGLEGDFSVGDKNGYSPTKQDILNGKCKAKDSVK